MRQTFANGVKAIRGLESRSAVQNGLNRACGRRM